MTANTALVLACDSGGLRFFESREQIGDETPAALSAHSGWLMLDGVNSLSAAAAASLIKHDHSLSLRDRGSISDVVEASLATYSRSLRLPTTAILSDVGLAVLSASVDTP